MRLEMVLCLPDGMGDARSVEWCPMGGTGGSPDAGERSGEDASGKRGKAKGKGKGKQKEDAMDVDGDEGTATHSRDKLGIVAAAFADGSVGVFVVPRPEDARERAGVAADSEEPAYGASRSASAALREFDEAAVLIHGVAILQSRSRLFCACVCPTPPASPSPGAATRCWR